MEVDDGCVVENCANSAVSRGCCIAHGGGKRCVFEGCATTARKGGFCFAHGGRSTSSTATNKRKMSSHTSPLAMTPATTTAESLLWSSEVRSPIPALNLPPRRLLPPIDAMLLANRPGILRRYQYTQIPSLRSPVISLSSGRQALKKKATKVDKTSNCCFPYKICSKTSTGCTSELVCQGLHVHFIFCTNDNRSRTGWVRPERPISTAIPVASVTSSTRLATILLPAA
ncbi:hypothetical protein PsorP6_009994 [Peronosclerospora sorghi]|uniref:Uncharacterized protein n=1 Tax=Peronosclerospora sorghi TaxID=230839 RepID=A0ACC0VVW0_9STRA|nr:hypothetical protein PsorP6_009994 [Peronosclerospora sorghi]